MPLTLVESPVANLANIGRALSAVGAEVVLTADPAVIAASRTIVLPGVGSFGAAMAWLRSSGVAEALETAAGNGASLLGICVGHQVLFQSSEEAPGVDGLGLLEGTVRRLSGDVAVPQIGWNRVTVARPSPLFDGLPEETAFYFVNSYAAMSVESEVAHAYYGSPFTAAAARGAIAGLQFHPEKSSRAGLTVLRNFVEQAG
jgi:glutamine amidotransferase